MADFVDDEEYYEDWFLFDAGVVSPYTWVYCTKGEIPSGAVWGGTHKDGDVYIGRVETFREVLPVSIVPNNKCGYVCKWGRVRQVDEYEVLCHQSRNWAYMTSGSPIPENAIEVKPTYNIEKRYYIGRVIHEGYITPGMVEADTKLLNIPFNNEVLVFEEYEILCAD